MESQDSSPAPPAGVRRIATVLILLHLFAVLTAVTSSSTPRFPAPALAVMANQPFQPYLQAAFLNNAYRFFAPNPGSPTVIWARVQYDDRSLHWVEAPRRDDCWLHPVYQRRLNLTVLLGQQAGPSEEGELRLNELGAMSVASFARHFAKVRAARHHDEMGVKSVGIYFLQHSPISPEQVRAGWEPIDLRTFQAVFVGAFTSEGARIDEFRPRLVAQPIADVAAGILETDLYPLVRKRADVEGLKLAEDLNLPMPLRRLLTRHPELLVPARDTKQRIERLFSASSGPGPVSR